MPIIEPACNLIRSRGILHPRLSLVVDISPSTVSVNGVGQAVRNQVFDSPSTRFNRELVVLDGVGQQFSDIGVNELCRRFGEQLLAKGIIGIDRYRL